MMNNEYWMNEFAISHIQEAHLFNRYDVGEALGYFQDSLSQSMGAQVSDFLWTTVYSNVRRPVQRRVPNCIHRYADDILHYIG